MLMSSNRRDKERMKKKSRGCVSLKGFTLKGLPGAYKGSTEKGLEGLHTIVTFE